MVAYETRLNADPRWALSEGSRHFEERSAVQDTLRGIARRLNDLGIPYAVSGGMALFHHGLRRFTEDVDILVTREGLTKIHESLSDLGYLPTIAQGKNLRDVNTGVRIDFLLAGDFPGDGKPKPISFPNPGPLPNRADPRASAPTTITEEHDGIQYLALQTLIELKLASGMTSPARLRDLSDVLELIRLLKLPATYADKLNLYVQPKFLELFQAAASASSES